MKGWKLALGKTYLFALLLVTYAPILTLVVYSFNSSKSRGIWGGFSLKWYQSLFQNQEILNALWTTLWLALLASVVATVLGTLAAIGIYNAGKVTKKLSMGIMYMPMLNSDIVTGISMMLLFSILRVQLGFSTLLLAHITFCIPYVALSILPKLHQVNRSVYEAALDLGCSVPGAYWKIIIPDIMPGIITGFLLAVTLSIDDFMISFFTTGQGVQNISIYVYTAAKRGIKPEINALSTILLVSVTLMLLIINLRQMRENKRNKNIF